MFSQYPSNDLWWNSSGLPDSQLLYTTASIVIGPLHSFPLNLKNHRLMKHVLTNRPMFHSDWEKLGKKILATKFSYSNQTWHVEKESSMWSVMWCLFVLCSISVFMSLDPFQNSINLFKRRMFDLNLSWGGVLDFRVQDLLAFFNDGTNCKPVSLISNLTETICVWAAENFWAAREIWARPIFTKVSMFCFFFFCLRKRCFLF